MPRYLSACAAILVASWAIQSSAAVVTFTGLTTDSNGTGFGSVLSVLTLQDNTPGADGLQAGSVVWGSAAEDEYGTVGGGIDTKSQASDTRTVAEMLAMGINASKFAIVLNLNQTGADDAINLHDFYIRFQNDAGATLFDARFDDSNLSNADTSSLTPAGQGIGSSGYLFPVTFSGSEGTSFFSNPTNRIGMYLNAADAMSGANGGQDTFYVAVPEPSGVALLLGGVLYLARRRAR